MQLLVESKKRNWKMNVAVTDSGGNLVAFQRMDGAMLASIPDRGTQGSGSRDLSTPDEGLRRWHPAYAS